MADLPDSLYERMLILRRQAGDENGFTEIVQRYHRRLHYYVRKLLGSEAGADDVLQDIWIDVFRKLRKLRDAGAFRAWLYRIARDHVYRLLRRKRTQFQFVDNLDGIVDDEEEAFSVEDAQWIHTALDRLSAEHCEVLVLRFIEDMSYEEIARATGLKVGTVRSRIYYAKQSMRNLLEEVSENER